jgi:hypothetical protein
MAKLQPDPVGCVDNTGRNALCWSFYYVYDNKLVNIKCFQLMKCIFCYASPILITNVKT